MYISFSGFKTYHSCSFAYWHNYINRTVPEAAEDRLGSIFGSAVGKLFEDFYNKEIWRKGSNARSFLAGEAERVVLDCIREETTESTESDYKRPGILRWKGKGEGQNPKGLYEDVEQLVADVRDTVPVGIETVKRERLLGPYAMAEVKLDRKFQGHDLGGRADFIIQRASPLRDLVIIDGKGSRHRHKYVSPKQLHWYALLHRLQYNYAPDKLAFLYWRYPPSENMDWVAFSSTDLDQLLEDILVIIREIEECSKSLPADAQDAWELAARVFRPKANEDNCRFCPYATREHCPRGHAITQKQKNRYR